MSEPPVAKYKLTLVIRGNSHAEIQAALLSQANGDYLINSGYEARDTFDVSGGRERATLEHINPAMTPERYGEELRAWCADRRTAKRTAT